MSDESKSLDILGAKPIADSISTLTSSAVKGAEEFLSRICLPVAKEIGLLLRDRVREWRAMNVAAIAARAQRRIQELEHNIHAHPRLASSILEEGSWIDDPVVQEMWAGLLSSSCTESGDDDSNLIFVNMLAQLTKLQARVLNFACENAQKRSAPNGLIQADEVSLTLEQLTELTGENDIHRLDRELDHLREMGLIAGGFLPYDTPLIANLLPMPLALNLFVRSQGTRVSPLEYFSVTSKEF